MAAKKSSKGSSKKGQAGKNTGSKTRTAIAAAKKKGCSDAEIGRAAGRSPSTIQSIRDGSIKNPPNGLAGRIRKTKCKKKK